MTDETPTPGEEPLPGTIAGYRILGLLGEGASGRVYRAMQASPAREVALKVLRTAALPNAVRQRFARESELLAQLEHPGIARLYASGVADTEAGPLPWLAIEYVRGTELLDYAEKHRLDLPARLGLLAQVCRTVHFAHTRGVIHRDLKPANILVDESGTAHVLDFGVAHLVREGSRVTAAGEVLGTVPYMSAEQLAGGLEAGDPRSDVYSLGVIAYELLSGRLPYPGLSRSTVIEALAMIREGRIERLSHHVPDASGDAETVVMKALSQEAAQRYGSAAELGADIERFLSRQPISARPPTAGYLIGLFVRRHRALSAALGFAALALVVGTIVSVRFALLEAKAERAASARAEEAAAVNDFLEKMLTASAPEADMGRDLRVRELLDAARASVDDIENPIVSARVHRMLGATYVSLAETDTALQMLDRALVLSTRASGADALATRQIAVAHAMALVQKTRFADADREFGTVIGAPAVTPEDWRLHFKAQRELAVSRAEQGQIREAAAMLDALHAEAAKRFGDEDGEVLVYAADHAAVAQIGGDAKSAVVEQRRLLEIQTKRLGADNPETLDVQGSLAVSLGDLEQWDEAIALSIDNLDRMRRIYGNTHPKTLAQIQNVASMSGQAGQKDRSLVLRKELLAASTARFGLSHDRTISALAMIANMESSLGQDGDAEAHYRQAIAAAGNDPALVTSSLIPRHNLATMYFRQNRLQEAKAVFESVIPDAARVWGGDDWQTAAFRANYGACLAKLGDLAGARAQLEPALKIIETGLGHDHDRAKDTRSKLREVYVKMHRDDLAQALDAPPPPSTTP